MTKTTTIPTQAIRELRTEAVLAGDDEMVAICDRALSGDTSARTECERVIRAAVSAIGDMAVSCLARETAREEDPS
jgi:hypothetical protein